MSDTSKREDDGRIRIWVNSGAKMSRGKYAAAAVHAALTAAGVHPGTPVIVLGGQRDDIERMRTVIHDAGRTEVEPGTPTAGTDYVFEQAHTPTDDEREALARAVLEAAVHPLIPQRDPAGTERDFADRLIASRSWPFRCTAVQEPSADHEGHEFCDRRLGCIRGAEPQGEPTDADTVLQDLAIRLNNEAYGKPNFTWGQIQRQIQGVEMARAALRAAAETPDENGSRSDG